MRPHALTPFALLVAALTACAPLRVDLPEGASVPEQSEFDYPPSELSAEEPLLCLDGERDGTDCTRSRELRWSVPLEGEYYVGTRGGRPILFDARNSLRGDSEYVGLVAEGMLHHFNHDLLHTHDTHTGEHLWTVDLRGKEPKQVQAVQRTDAHLVVGLNDGRRGTTDVEELVTLDPEDGSERMRTAVGGPSGASLLGVGADGEALVFYEGPDEYFGVSTLSGEELWRVEVEFPLDLWEIHRQHRWIQDGDLVIEDTERPHSESEWERTEVRRFDGGTGEEIEEVGTVDSDSADPQNTHIRYEVGSMVEEFEEEDSADLRQYLPIGHGSDRQEALAGVGMGFLSPAGEIFVGFACPPDALHVENPPTIPDTVRCDNPRLFMVNG